MLRCTATAVAAPPPTSSYKKAKIHQDYAAVDSDSAVLKRPLKDVLTAEEVKDVFGYPRTSETGVPSLTHVMLAAQHERGA